MSTWLWARRQPRQLLRLRSGELALAYTNGQTDKSRRLMLSRPTVADRLQRFGSSGWLCGQQGLEPVAHYRALARTHNAPRLKPPFHLAARLSAGFTQQEIDDLLGA